MIRTTRIETALQLRDHALTILRRHGRLEPIRNGPSLLMWRGESFSLWLQTPFQNLNYGPDRAAKSLAAKHGLSLDEAKYAAALHGIKLQDALPYCLDIAQARKVMSLEWVDDGRANIISFKRGPWEAELLSLVI